MNKNKNNIKYIMQLKKITGAKITACKEALEKYDFDEAKEYLNTQKKISSSGKEKKYHFCQIDHLKENKFIFLSFKTETDFVVNFLKRTNKRDILLPYIDKLDNSEGSFVYIKERLENTLSSLTKEEIVLLDLKILKDIIFYNNLNGDSCSYIEYKDNTQQDKKIDYLVLHSDFVFKLSQMENVLKSLCVSINCLEKEEVTRLNSYIKKEITSDKVNDILDVFSEKSILEKLTFLEKKGIEIKGLNRIFANDKH